MKKCYFGRECGNTIGIAVIAENQKQAKKLLWPILNGDYGVESWINMQVTIVKGARIDDLPIGHVFESEGEIQDGVERGAYEFCEACEATVYPITSGDFCSSGLAERKIKQYGYFEPNQIDNVTNGGN